MGTIFNDYSSSGTVTEDDLEFSCMRVFYSGQVGIYGSKNGSINIANFWSSYKWMM